MLRLPLPHLFDNLGNEHFRRFKVHVPVAPMISLSISPVFTYGKTSKNHVLSVRLLENLHQRRFSGGLERNHEKHQNNLPRETEWMKIHFTPWGSWKSGSEKPVSNCCLGSAGKSEMEGSGKSMSRFFVIREISCIRYHANQYKSYNYVHEPGNLNDTSGLTFHLSKLCLLVVKILKKSGIVPCKKERLYLTTW